MKIISGLLSFLGIKEITGGQTDKIRFQKPAPFEIQLEIFKKLGFTLNPEIEFSDINRWGGTEEFEKEPFSLLYITLGQTLEEEPWTPLTNRCWHFDTEAIENHGDYVRIMKNLERISGGEIKFENLRDYVDIEEEEAWVSFTVNEVEYRWNLEVNDDWVDRFLFSNVVELPEEFGTKGKYTYFDTGGQDLVIGFETPEKLKEIIEATELKIEWLS